MKPIISICIPCCKRIDYVRKTLDSIYKTNSDVLLQDYEVVVSDNDPEAELNVLVKEYNYPNFHYYESKCAGFMNSFYALSYGTGVFLLLHNSQELFRGKALGTIVDLVRSNNRSFIFFSSGFLLRGDCFIEPDFDSFMNAISYWSSWSNAFGIRKSEFDKIKDNITLNQTFPHTSLLMTQTGYSSYLICDFPLFMTQFVRGRSGHNKFHAFVCEYPSLIDMSYRQGNISKVTRNSILRGLLYTYLPFLYFNVKIARREMWDSDGFNKKLKYFFPKYSYFVIVLLSLFTPFRICIRRIKRIFLLLKKSK